MSSSAISNIEFNQSVEKLKTDSSNWIMFQCCFTIAMNDHELYEHLTGDAVQPLPVDAAKPTNDKKASIKEWKKNENKAMSLLVSWLHDSTFTKYMRKTTIAEIWAGLITEFSMCSMLQTLNFSFLYKLLLISYIALLCIPSIQNTDDYHTALQCMTLSPEHSCFLSWLYGQPYIALCCSIGLHGFT